MNSFALLPPNTNTKRNNSSRFALSLLLLFAIFLAKAWSAPLIAEGVAPGIKRPGKAVIVPDRFLRRWDPITLFFDDAIGPPRGGPEDNPGRVATLSPDHPGAYTWLDAQTLQFRPAEPWPPLTGYRWKFQGREVQLTTLMSAPVKTIPGDNSRDLASVEAITMEFADPLNKEVLSEILTMELRPLPGVKSDQSRWLTKDDFDIKALERRNRSDHAGYVILLRSPIPYGTRAIIHLRLSLADKVDEAFKTINFSTAQPFHVTHLGCADQRYPVTMTGVRYERDRAVQCSSRNRAVQVQFSSRLGDLGPVEARNLVRFTPSVKDLEFKTAGNSLTITGDFVSETLYKVDLIPFPVTDLNGRKLQMEGPSGLFLFFPKQTEFLRWDVSRAIMERYGPQMVPLQGRGFQRLDLRIYPVNPLDRSFWPFPDGPIGSTTSNVLPPPERSRRPIRKADIYRPLSIGASDQGPGISRRFRDDFHSHRERRRGRQVRPPT